MKSNFDKSQFGNQKGTSIQHYLLKLINKILHTLDRNSKGEILAVIANLYDWSQAFDLQCPKLEMVSDHPYFLLSVISYLQNRKMIVKWHGILLKMRNLNGCGPQGNLGISVTNKQKL